MDTETGEIRFYNSLRAQPGHKDMYLEDAKGVVGLFLYANLTSFNNFT